MRPENEVDLNLTVVSSNSKEELDLDHSRHVGKRRACLTRAIPVIVLSQGTGDSDSNHADHVEKMSMVLT